MAGQSRGAKAEAMRSPEKKKQVCFSPTQTTTTGPAELGLVYRLSRLKQITLPTLVALMTTVRYWRGPHVVEEAPATDLNPRMCFRCGGSQNAFHLHTSAPVRAGAG